MRYLASGFEGGASFPKGARHLPHGDLIEGRSRACRAQRVEDDGLRRRLDLRVGDIAGVDYPP